MMHNSWPTDLPTARAIQAELRARVVTHDDHGAINIVAGVDAGYRGDLAHAAVVAFSYPDLRPLAYATAESPPPLPYIPGFLSFREGPAVMAALDALSMMPDLLIFDGQGIAHPRRLGIASHIGVLRDTPSIGCAKSLLVGRHAELPDERGAHVALVDRDEAIGVVLRTRVGVKPVYISSGHRISLASAIEIIMACTGRYRLPLPIRAAHDLASNNKPPTLETLL